MLSTGVDIDVELVFLFYTFLVMNMREPLQHTYPRFLSFFWRQKKGRDEHSTKA